MCVCFSKSVIESNNKDHFQFPLKYRLYKLTFFEFIGTLYQVICKVQVVESVSKRENGMNGMNICSYQEPEVSSVNRSKCVLLHKSWADVRSSVDPSVCTR